jgi:DNA-binding NtrC family response regulator
MSTRPLQLLLADPNASRRAAIAACARDLGLDVRSFETLEQMRAQIADPDVGIVVIGAPEA